MKIKKEVLKQIIAEEKQKLLKESIEEAGPGIMGKIKKHAKGIGAGLALGTAAVGGASMETAADKDMQGANLVSTAHIPGPTKERAYRKIYGHDFKPVHGNYEMELNLGIGHAIALGKAKVENDKLIVVGDKFPGREAPAQIAPMKESMAAMLDRIVSEELKAIKKNVNKA